jgi:hypothetical protein
MKSTLYYCTFQILIIVALGEGSMTPSKVFQQNLSGKFMHSTRLSISILLSQTENKTPQLQIALTRF